MEEVKAEEKQYCKQLNMTSGGESKKRFPVKKQSRSSDGSTMQKIVCGGVLLLLVFSEGASAATALPVIMREENVYSSTGSSEFLTFRIPGNGTISADLCFSPLNVCVNVTRDWMYLEGTANYTLRILPEYNETTMVLIVRDSTGSHYSNSINMTVNSKLKFKVSVYGITIAPLSMLVLLARPFTYPQGGGKDRAYNISFPSTRIVGNNILACIAYGVGFVYIWSSGHFAHT